MTTFKIAGGTQDGTEKQGVYIPGTDKQLAAVCFEKGSWSITHVASGYAVAFCSGKDRAMACGRYFWALLSPEGRELMRDNADLAEQDKQLARVAGNAHRRLIEVKNLSGLSRHNRIVDAYSNARIVEMAKALEAERTALASA